MRASRRLYEVAVIVQAEYQEAADAMDAERDARAAGLPLKVWEEKADPEIPF